MTVPQVDLDSFIRLATELKLKGLEAMSEEQKLEGTTPIEDLHHMERVEVETSPKVEVSREKEPKETGIVQQEKDKPRSVQQWKERDPTIEHQSKPEGNDVIVKIGEKNEILEAEILSILENKEGFWFCRMCAKSNKKLTKAKLHAEIHIDGFLHPCPHCEKMCKTTNVLGTHMYKHHSKYSIAEKFGLY